MIIITKNNVQFCLPITGTPRWPLITTAQYQYYFHSQYPTVGPKVTLYHRCVHRKTCQGKVVIKGGVIQGKEHHSFEVKEKQMQQLMPLKEWPIRLERLLLLNQQNLVQIVGEGMEASSGSFILDYDKFRHMQIVCIYIWKNLDII